MKYPPLKNYINGKPTAASTAKALEVISPIDGTLLSTVPMSTAKDLNDAVMVAQKAFVSWSRKPIKERVQVFFKFKTLLERDLNILAALVQEENGKTLGEAVAEVEKCIELTEFATSLPQLISGEVLEVSKGVECRTEHVPLGIVASIVPFNFPAMVPNWTIPNAIALGNCMIMKPSEKVPMSCMKIAELLQEAGLPDGVFNIVNGFGYMGPTGAGADEAQGCQEGVDLYFSTFVKSMGSIGAFIAGPKNILMYLRYNVRSQIFAKSLPLIIVDGMLKRMEMLKTMPELREKLWSNVTKLQAGLKERGFDIGNTNSPVTPIYMKGDVPEATQMVMDLRENYHIFCSIVVYPVIPKGDIIYRIIPTAAHSDEDIELTLKAFEATKKKLDAGAYKAEKIPDMAEKG